ncbi:MAG: hypothetical protein U9Q03_02125 [Patescibacteria group bacterium]|nr:hypothetical protein [Patescibacteria group bacterium]
MGVDIDVLPRAVIEYKEPTVVMVDGELKPPTVRDELALGPELEIIVG